MRKINYVLLPTFVLLSGNSFSSDGNLKTNFENGNKLNSVSLPSEIPFQYSNRLIILNARINDKSKSYRFLLDSGAPTFISNEVVSDFNLKSSSIETAFDINSNIHSVNYFYLDKLSIAEKYFSSIGAASIADNTQMAPLAGRADGGLIGANVMRNCIWMIDYQNKKIILTDNLEKLNLGNNVFISKMSLNNFGSPVVNAILPNGKSVNFIVDVGYNGSVLLPPKYFTKPLFSDIEVQNKTELLSTGFSSQTENLQYQYLKEINIGCLKSTNVKSSSIGKNTEALIGNEFLENFNVIFDFPDHKFILIPVKEKQKTIEPQVSVPPSPVLFQDL